MEEFPTDVDLVINGGNFVGRAACKVLGSALSGVMSSKSLNSVREKQRSDPEASFLNSSVKEKRSESKASFLHSVKEKRSEYEVESIQHVPEREASAAVIAMHQYGPEREAPVTVIVLCKFVLERDAPVAVIALHKSNGLVFFAHHGLMRCELNSRVITGDRLCILGCIVMSINVSVECDTLINDKVVKIIDLTGEILVDETQIRVVTMIYSRFITTRGRRITHTTAVILGVGPAEDTSVVRRVA